MSDPKTERLINLTMALLASRRLLTKSEIFSSVAGYSGSQDSMERMFERDKDDLRSLGIEIEVDSIDPFFEDELGYRVLPERYALHIPDFTPVELSLLSLAARSWRTETLSSSAQTGLTKLESLGVDVDPQLLSTSIIAFDNSVPDFDLLWSAITQAQTITFDYHAKDITTRDVNPYGLTLHKGEWYLAGFDLDKKAIRTFKLRRMSNVAKNGKIGAFSQIAESEIAHAFDFSNFDSAITAIMKIRKNKSFNVRTNSKMIKEDSEWDTVSRKFSSLQIALHEVLWAGQDIVVESPENLRLAVIANLSAHANGVTNNG